MTTELFPRGIVPASRFPRPAYRRSFPANMPRAHRRQYVKTLRDIRFNEFYGINSGWVECLRNANHSLISLYIAPTPKEAARFLDDESQYPITAGPGVRLIRTA